MKYEWDETKRLSNLSHHGLDFADVIDFDWESTLILDAMTDEDIHHGILADPDVAPELTEEDVKRIRHASEVLPHIVEAYRAQRLKQTKPTEVVVSIRLSQEVIDYFRSQGEAWQSRINDVLREYVADHR